MDRGQKAIQDLVDLEQRATTPEIPEIPEIPPLGRFQCGSCQFKELPVTAEECQDCDGVSGPKKEERSLQDYLDFLTSGTYQQREGVPRNSKFINLTKTEDCRDNARLKKRARTFKMCESRKEMML